MLRIHATVSLDEPGLAPYRTLRRPEEHDRAGLFVAEGPRVIGRLLESALTVESLLGTAEWVERFRARLEARPEPIEVYVVAEERLRPLTGFHLFNGVLAVARRPGPPDLARLLGDGSRPDLWLALDGLTNAENVGPIVRSAVALGVGAILVGETCASPWLRRAVRTSMGAVFAVPVVRSRNLAADLAALRSAGIRVLVAEAAGGVPLREADLRRPLCLVLGGENAGARPAVRAACAGAVTIPMPGGCDSLNVSAAAAILVYEAARGQPPR